MKRNKDDGGGWLRERGTVRGCSCSPRRIESHEKRVAKEDNGRG